MQKAATQYGTWVSYSGVESILLALVLLGVAGALTYLATRLHLPRDAKRPGKATATFMIGTWVLSIVTFLICAFVYVQQVRQLDLVGSPPADPIGFVTYPSVLVTFIIVYYLAEPRGIGTALASGLIGALAAPLIFELPFDIIVMSRTYPPIPPDPALYRALFFLPLFLVEISTLSLLMLSPLVRLSKSTLRALAAMFGVFAIWAALFGFAYPSSPGPIVLNDVAKVLAFVAAITLFVPPGWRLARGETGRQPRPDPLSPPSAAGSAPPPGV
ncbi:MAG: hypothetical protein ACYDCI_11905 [Candidatus Limnocylindrales bacterium]